MTKYKGLIAAAFTPMKEDGTLNMEQVPHLAEHMIADGISGLYVCGSTGEGPLLSGNERRRVAEAYVSAVEKRIPVIVQIGHDSLFEARELALHAQQIGADAVSAIAPRYFGCDTLDTLIDCLCEITSVVPDMPFFYYHIPSMSGITFDMKEFLEKTSSRIPNLAGIKYSAPSIHEFQECLALAGDQYFILFGCDEMLLSALSVGAHGAVGSTYNFAAPLHHGIIEAYHKGDMELAQRLQLHSVEMCRLLYQYRGQPAFKAMMGLLGDDCGPNRLPLQTLSKEEIARLREDIERLGFFEWGRSKK